MRRNGWGGFAVTAALAAFLLLPTALAAAPGKGNGSGGGKKGERAERVEKLGAATDGDAKVAEEKSEGRARSKNRRGGGGEEVTLEDGRKVRSYTFGTVDLEGKLKTPQLLYFLNRVKVELDSTHDARRSFVKELKATADEKGL